MCAFTQVTDIANVEFSRRLGINKSRVAPHKQQKWISLTDELLTEKLWEEETNKPNM